MTEVNKYENYYHLLNHWMRARWYGHGVSEYLLEHGYRRVAIYGISDFANHLFDELSNGQIEAVYGIDRDSCNSNTPIEEIYHPDDQLPEVDVLIVTPYFYFKEISTMMSGKLHCPIISLENIIWSI